MEMVGIVLIVIVVLIGWFISTSNTLNRAIVKVDESKSGVEIQLKRRYDILTQSFNVAKGYMKHEESVFANLRAVNSGMSVAEMNETIDNQGKAISGLMALAESYPELRSEELFSNLQNQLSEENAQLAAAKRALNANITKINNLVVSFPSSIVCSMKGQGKEEFLKEENVEAIKDVKLTF